MTTAPEAAPNTAAMLVMGHAESISVVVEHRDHVEIVRNVWDLQYVFDQLYDHPIVQDYFQGDQEPS